MTSYAAVKAAAGRCCSAACVCSTEYCKLESMLRSRHGLPTLPRLAVCMPTAPSTHAARAPLRQQPARPTPPETSRALPCPACCLTLPRRACAGGAWRGGLGGPPRCPLPAQGRAAADRGPGHWPAAGQQVSRQAGRQACSSQRCSHEACGQRTAEQLFLSLGLH
jgi:hypothetical protein